jgi:hypothetical protein
LGLRSIIRIEACVTLPSTIAKPENRPILDAIEVDTIPLVDYRKMTPNFIKLDIEGAEVAALRGAQKLLREHKPKMFVEVHTQMFAEHGETLTNFFSLIPRDGFAGWSTHQPGAEAEITKPIVVSAWPRG